MLTRKLATAAAACSLAVLCASPSFIASVGGSPCDWDFVTHGKSSAYAYSMTLEPDGSSFAATVSSIGDCSCEDNSNTSVCEDYTTQNVGVLRKGINDANSGSPVYLNYTDYDLYRIDDVVLPPGPGVTNEYRDDGHCGVENSCFAVEPVPGPVLVYIYKSDEFLNTGDEYGSYHIESYALCTKAEYLFDHSTSKLNGVGCTGMAGRIEVTTLYVDLLPLGEAEIYFKCPAGAFPTCETDCVVTVNDREHSRTLSNHNSSSNIWETEDGVVCYAAGDAGEYGGPVWSLPSNNEYTPHHIGSNPCATLPNEIVRRLSVSPKLVGVQLLFLVLVMTLSMYTLQAMFCCSFFCCCCDGCCRSSINAGLGVIGWVVSVLDTGCEVTAIFVMLSSVYYCGINDYCDDGVAVAIILVVIGQAIPTTLSVVVLVKETLGKQRPRPEAIGSSMKYILRITDPDASFLRALIAVIVPSAFAIGAYLPLDNNALAALPGSLAVLVGIITANVTGGQGSELSGLFLTYMWVDWMTVANAFGLPSAIGDASPILAIMSKTAHLFLVLFSRCYRGETQQGVTIGDMPDMPPQA